MNKFIDNPKKRCGIAIWNDGSLHDFYAYEIKMEIAIENLSINISLKVLNVFLILNMNLHLPNSEYFTNYGYSNAT